MKTTPRLLSSCAVSATAMILALPARAEIPTRLEPVYSEAVLAFNGKDYNKSLAMLDQLLSTRPGVVEALELKALILKAKHDERESAKVYQDLIQAKLNEGNAEKDVAPYRYELGLIRFRENNPAEARVQLESAVKEGFNAPAAHFFLGLIEFRGNSLTAAEAHFREASSSGIPELKTAADFYLGQIYSRWGYSSGATQRYFSARGLSLDVLEDAKADAEAKKIASQIHDATEKALKPFDRSGMFGNVGIVMGYDTNVLSVPSAAISIDPESGSGAKTLKTTLQGGVGYSTSPLNSWQLVPSYRGSVNFNYNEDAKAGEFFLNDVSLYLTHNALARYSWGVKLEGIYTFQNGGDSRFHFGSYSLLLPFGPYLRYEIAPKVVFSADLNLMPQHYFLDTDEAPSLRRSGFDKNLRLALRNDRGERLFNPGFSVLFDLNDTDSSGSNTMNGGSGDDGPSEFSSKSVAFELSNLFRPTEAMTVTATVSAAFPRYEKRVDGPRQDRTYALDLNGLYRLSPKYALVGDVQYIDNQSTISSLYEYKRFVVSVGATYSF